MRIPVELTIHAMHVSICSLYLKKVMPRWQLRIVRLTSIADVYPISIDPIQSVAESNALRRIEYRGSKVDLKVGVARSDLDSLSKEYRLLIHKDAFDRRKWLAHDHLTATWIDRG